MSLINEALKKAQKQRTHDPLSAIPLSVPSGAPPPRVAKRKDPMPAQTLVIISTLCLVLLVALGAGAWFVFKESAVQIAASHGDAKTAAQKASSSPAPASPADAPPPIVSLDVAPPKAPVPASAPGTATTDHAVPSPVAMAVNGVPPPTAQAGVTASSGNVPGTAQGAEGIASPSSGVAAASPPVPTPTEIIQITAADLKHAATPDPKVLAVVDTFKVSGIRASPSDPKVLMNDRVFRLNDIVERTYGLRLTEVHPDRLTFVDDVGAVYTKTF